MSMDIYSAPAAELAQEEVEPEFYVVSMKKYLLLMVGTMGIYEIYWFYRHWRA